MKRFGRTRKRMNLMNIMTIKRFDFLAIAVLVYTDVNEQRQLGPSCLTYLSVMDMKSESNVLQLLLCVRLPCCIKIKLFSDKKNWPK